MIAAMEGGRKTNPIRVFADDRRAFVQAAQLRCSRVRWSILSTPAQLLCAAQQLSDCKFWVRVTTGGVPRRLP
jgi:hypothetical protein